MPLEAHDLSRLRSQMSRAEIVLFTGAGFSLDARDFHRNQLPSGEGLRRELWDLCYGGSPFDPAASLADLYAAALRLRGADLQSLLQRRLTVDPQSLPDYYRVYFSLPWLRCFTLNIDDLERAADNRFRLRLHDMRRSFASRNVGNFSLSCSRSDSSMLPDCPMLSMLDNSLS